MVKVYQKVYKMSKALSYFTTNTWIFNDLNLQGLQKTLSKADNTIFNFDMENIDWQEYEQVWTLLNFHWSWDRYLLKATLFTRLRVDLFYYNLCIFKGCIFRCTKLLFIRLVTYRKPKILKTVEIFECRCSLFVSDLVSMTPSWKVWLAL